MTKIFESPDKGKTVYVREFGAPNSTKKLVKETKKVKNER